MPPERPWISGVTKDVFTNYLHTVYISMWSDVFNMLKIRATQQGIVSLCCGRKCKGSKQETSNWCISSFRNIAVLVHSHSHEAHQIQVNATNCVWHTPNIWEQSQMTLVAGCFRSFCRQFQSLDLALQSSTLRSSCTPLSWELYLRICVCWLAIHFSHVPFFFGFMKLVPDGSAQSERIHIRKPHLACSVIWVARASYSRFWVNHNPEEYIYG